MDMNPKCKNCANYEGDCGHHFYDEKGHTVYDCPRESCCDSFGCCSFYEETRSKYRVALDLLDEGKRNQIESQVIREALEYMIAGEERNREKAEG